MPRGPAALRGSRRANPPRRGAERRGWESAADGGEEGEDGWGGGEGKRSRRRRFAHA